ncbi:Lrp/AsnC family transcriptional regulator [Brevundimonas sp. NPDC090276]|uniref:Lrp/AsnC family transcriptional regulator n=1 Tax=Brevundimonas sp. NPDC090276 TaxID=3363956 RepID=UPI00383A954E
MSPDIDPTNAKILALLRADARMSVSAIGKSVHLSRQAVQDRINRMEQSGVIRGYRAEVSEAAGSVQAVLTVKIADRPCAPALEWLAALSGVTSVMSVSGDSDAVALVSLPSLDALSQLNDAVATSPLISAKQSQIVLRRY